METTEQDSSAFKMNSIFIIQPYRKGSVWVFDEPALGIQSEPFVTFANKIIDLICSEIPDAEKGFDLIFSKNEFPGWKYKFDWVKPEFGGNTYWSEDLKEYFYLCPVLNVFIDPAPPCIYAVGQPSES